MSRIEDRLRELEIELPEPSKPGANYVPAVRSGNLVFLTGQLSQWNGERRFIGKLGHEFGVEEGRQAARLCALNLIAHLKGALGGDFARVARCVRLAGYVNSTPDFTGQAQVMRGASIGTFNFSRKIVHVCTKQAETAAARSSSGFAAPPMPPSSGAPACAHARTAFSLSSRPFFSPGLQLAVTRKRACVRS